MKIKETQFEFKLDDVQLSKMSKTLEALNIVANETNWRADKCGSTFGQVVQLNDGSYACRGWYLPPSTARKVYEALLEAKQANLDVTDGLEKEWEKP